MKSVFTRAILTAAMVVMAAANTRATGFTVLYDFPYGNGAGFAGLMLSGNTLYGAAQAGGNGEGSLFQIGTNGSGFNNFYSFTKPDGVGGTNGDGGSPRGALVLSGTTFYGTAASGGLYGGGTVFKVNTDGSGFTTLHNFLPATDGSAPSAGLVLSSNMLYGTTTFANDGVLTTVFGVSTDGTTFVTVHVFDDPGTMPLAGLVASGNTLYGTTFYGNNQTLNVQGSVFKVNTDGSGFTNLHVFSPTAILLPISYAFQDGPTNADGNGPSWGSLVLSGNTLYGTTTDGGASGEGTVYAVNTDGTGFANLHSFGFYYEDNALGTLTNKDGGFPLAGLVLSGETLYGVTSEGGYYGGGTIFGIDTNGGGFTNLHNFGKLVSNGLNETNYDGWETYGDLVVTNRTLFGTAYQGGPFGFGTVFALDLPAPPVTSIPLNIDLSAGNAVLSWKNPAFSLFAASAANGPYASLPGAVSPYTNAATANSRFFLLKSN
jgi:uncharacterized repeat protein (TIGR03803 family)